MTQFNAFTITDTIAIGTALGAGANINGLDLVGLEMSIGWDAAAITLSQSNDGITWRDIYDNTGAEVSISVAAGHYVPLSYLNFGGLSYVRIRSGTGGVPVNQSAARALIWHARILGR